MRKTIISLLLLIALGCYFFMVEKKKDSDERKEKSASLLLLPVAKGDSIERITIAKNGTSFTVEGKDDLWRIVDPVLEMGNSLMISGIDKVLRLQRKESSLHEPSDDRSVYGLDPPEITVTIKTVLDPHERSLLLGKKAPLGEFYYASWGTTGDVFLINVNARNAMDKDLSEIRSRDIFSFSQQDVVHRIELASPLFTLKTEYDQKNNQWRIHEPFEELARHDMMQELLTNISGIYVEKFLDDKDVDDPAFGLKDSPNYIKISTQLNKEVVVRLGALTEDAKHYYAYIEGRTSPVLVAADMIDSLRKDPATFIERRIAFYDPRQVQTITYERGGNERIIERVDLSWHLNGVALDTEGAAVVDSMVVFLSDLEFSTVLNDEGIKSLGLAGEEPLFTFVVMFPEPKYGVSQVAFNFIAKADGFFVTCSIDKNFYEISQSDYQKIIDFVDGIYDRE